MQKSQVEVTQQKLDQKSSLILLCNYKNEHSVFSDTVPPPTPPPTITPPFPTFTIMG